MVKIMSKDDSQLKNKIYTKDGLIYVEYIGDQSGESVALAVGDLNKLIEEAKSKNKSAFVVCDISRVAKHNAGARKVGQEALNTLGYDKFAICGGDFFVRSIAGILVKGIGKTDTVKFFKTQEEAVRWLKS